MLYIASSLHNKARVAELRDSFQAVGVELTYDWSRHGEVTDPAAVADIAMAELQGVLDAKCVLVVTPARNGAYFEFGAAYATGTPIVLLLEEPPPYPISFHHLPGLEVCETAEQAIQSVLRKLDHASPSPNQTRTGCNADK